MAINLERNLCDCGGLLDLIRTSSATTSVNLTPAHSLSEYRYSDQLPCRIEDLLQVSLGADMVTPLLQEHGQSNTWLKCDHLLPTGSFKDRGATVLAALALQLGAKRIVIDSSGNAAASMAAHAARAAIACHVFMPDSTAQAKVQQARAMGAHIELISGSRDDAKNAATAAARDRGSFYASHVLNPHFHHGVKTWSFEVCDQLGREPGTVVLPVGNGSLLLGVALGFRELLAQGRIKNLPRIVAVQSEAFSTLGPPRDATVMNEFRTSVAQGVAISSPARRRQIIDTLDETQGLAVAVSDLQILQAQKELGTKGFYVEPTGVLAWAGYRSIEHSEGLAGPVVVALTGSGFKSECST